MGPHNRQVPCSSQGRATIFLLQIIKLLHTRRLIDFGSHWNSSEKPPFHQFCPQSAAAWFWSLAITDVLGLRNFVGGFNCGALRVEFGLDFGLTLSIAGIWTTYDVAVVAKNWNPGTLKPWNGEYWAKKDLRHLTAVQRFQSLDGFVPFTVVQMEWVDRQPNTGQSSVKPEGELCAKTGHSTFLKTTKACSLSRHSAMLKPC